MAISVTQKAWKKIGNILTKANNNYGLLFSATTGGCNGFNFQLELLTEDVYDGLNKERFITVLEEKSSRVFVDPHSELHLSGTTIDYVHEDLAKGIFENKFVYNVDKDLMATCGCGSSFVPRQLD